MTAIPPVDERKHRSCSGEVRTSPAPFGMYVSFVNSCVFYRYDMCVRGIERDMECKTPCLKHITEEEFDQLIDQHNLIERIPLSPEIQSRIKAVIDQHNAKQVQE